MKWSLRIGSIIGIPIKVHLTFILLLVLVFFAGTKVIGLGGLAGVIFICLVFASVVFHELAHSLVARHYGIEVVDITLLPIGGVARMAKPPEKPAQEMLIAAAGPAASFALAVALLITADLVGSKIPVSDFSLRTNLIAQLCAVNFVLAVFNLVPAFPMDGGRILRGFLGLYLHPLKATRIAVGVGQVFAAILFFLGLLSMNLFMILIALFVYIGAESEEKQMGVMLTLEGVTAKSTMITDLEVVSPEHRIGEVADRYCHSFQGDFPVVDDRGLTGLVTRETLTEALHKLGPSVKVGEIMRVDYPIALEDTPLTEILQKMQEAGSKVVPIMRQRELVGLVTLEQIGRYNMLCAGFSCEFIHPGRTDPSKQADSAHEPQP
ncbi:site-2 protease family protein [Thermodesulfobacteriota bacterium]